MSRRLLTIGSIFLLATAALWVAGATDGMDGATADRWSDITLNAGLITLAAGLLSRLLSPLLKALGRGRCAVCGNHTERGHSYCLDHLQETVNAARDQARDETGPRRAHPHPQP